MKTKRSTLVLQSYKTTRVDPWIHRCMESVQGWAVSNGYEYEFIDDRLFDFAPDWFRERCSGELLPVTDIARLYLLKEKLGAGNYHQVVWIDADVLVFAQDFLNLENVREYALCGEIWIYQTQDGQVGIKRKVNNSMMVVTWGNTMLDFLLFAGEEIVRHSRPGKIGFLDVGTNLLTQLAKAMPIRILPGAGVLSPAVILDITGGGGPALDRFTSACTTRIGAANLCGSLVGKESMSTLDTAVMENVVEMLIASQGSMLFGKIHVGN